MIVNMNLKKVIVCLSLIAVLVFPLSACGKKSASPVDPGTPANQSDGQDPVSPSGIEKLNPNDANLVLAAVLSSPYITCLGKTRLEMDAAFGPIAGNEWVDGMLYYHENYPGMVSYTNAVADYEVKENDICIVAFVLLREVVPEMVGKSLSVDAGVWGAYVLDDLTSTYQYEIPIKNGFMTITCDENGNIDLDSVIFAKLESY